MNTFDFSAFAFDPNEYEEKSYEVLPAGEYRIRIDNVEPKTSKNGNPYFAFEFAVSGDNRKIWHNLVLTSDKKVTNDKLGAFFNSFGIKDYDLAKWQSWAGRIGGAKTKIRPAENGYSEKAEVHFFLSAEKVEKLPAWVEPDNGILKNAPEVPGMSVMTSAPPWEQF